MAKRGKKLLKSLNPFNMAKKGSSKVKKSATVKNLKSYGKVALALGTAGAGYAVLNETVRGATRAFAPTASPMLEWNYSNTEVGLAAQTLLFTGASSMAAKVLKDLNILNTKEAKVAATAGMGFAVGRHLTGTSLFDIGKRFDYLMDGEIGSAIKPGPGPAVTTPANAAAASQIITRTTNDSMNVSNAYLQNRASRGVPYTNQGLNQKRVVVGNENYGYQYPSSLESPFTALAEYL